MAVSMVSIGRAKSLTNSAAGFLKGGESNYAGAARLRGLQMLRPLKKEGDDVRDSDVRGPGSLLARPIHQIRFVKCLKIINSKT